MTPLVSLELTFEELCFGPGFASTVTCKWVRVNAASPRQRPQAQRPGEM